ASAQRSLEHVGVEVRTNTVATEITAEHVKVGEEVIPTHTTLWAAGVAASPLGRQLGVNTDRSGRVPVLPDLTVPGHPEVYALGDLAALKDGRGHPLPGTAPVAIQQGQHAARNIWRVVHGHPTRPF